MKKILFVTTCIGGGGAERVLLYLLNYFSKIDEYNVILLLIRNEGNDYLNDLAGKVEVHNLGLDNYRIRYCIFKLLKKIYTIKPDICFINHVELNILIAPFIKLLPRNIKFVARETSVLSVRYLKQKWKKCIYYFFYCNYDLVIAQSDDMLNDLILHWFVKPQKCIKINNPIDIDLIKQKAKDTVIDSFFQEKTYNLLAIGKLTFQKGYDVLLQRLSESVDLNFKLLILGKGELKNSLQNLIEKLDLSEKVVLGGYSQYSSAHINNADGIILASRYEGFPNVLLEANALGKPVLVNCCLGGINEIVVSGINGYVVDFMSDKDFRCTFEKFINSKFNKTIICQMTKDRYSIDIILPQYESALNSLFL